ncbi:hypothetical protein [Mucilaginibacter sp. OK098]|uniref:hypothetical protein n=1 Tax=Mucilaginibacter sp. OK098 TaxID=1855297 RepID=UPI00091F2F15|nr:hypothetical protein [Mucilaginibacter sp. OK098]SHN30292.1 hypothetical protein SAMN05216524_10912 [Mucilaginibacter sp. OK098]
MKTFLITTVAFLAFTITCKAQWTLLGNNLYPTTISNNVGIGTSSLAAKLTISNTSTTGLDQLVLVSTLGAGAQSGIVFRTPYSGTTYDGSITSSFYNGTGGMIFTAPRDYPGDYGFQFNSNSGTPRMFINTLNGNVGIGTVNPDQLLTVNGTIHSKSVVVDANIFPDYVFNKDYALPSLTEVKTYIDQNHHLPDVPSAAEVEKNGLNLGEMNRVLVQKVEELTLYLIEQNKQLAEQSKQLIDQQKQIGDLKKSRNNSNHNN